MRLRHFLALLIIPVLVLSAGDAEARRKRKKPPPPAPSPSPSPEPEPTPEPEASPPPAPSPSAAPTPSPEPEASPTPEPGAGDKGIDVDALRREADAVRDELFRSRAKVRTITSSLYSSKISVDLKYGAGRFFTLRRLIIKLDGARIFDDPEGLAKAAGPLFEGFLAPGRHTLSFRVEATSKDDETFTYITEDTFAFEAKAGKLSRVSASMDEDGSIADGTYDVRLKVKVSPQALK